MQMVKKSVLIFLMLWFAILLFMPKAELYYTIEKSLAKQDIKLNEKSIEEGPFSLTLKDVTVYVKGIALAKIEELDFFTLLFYSSLELSNLKVDEALQTKVPATTKEASFTHSILSPLSISIDANGSFGAIDGKVNIINKDLRIDFVEVGDIGMIQPHLTKDEKGWFYEKSF
jgi:hypothetical protein